MGLHMACRRIAGFREEEGERPERQAASELL